MDWLEFIASLVGSLAWPIVVVVIALVFRRAIKTTLNRPLRRFKVGPLEAEWEEQRAEALVEVAKSPEGDAPPSAHHPVTDPLRIVAEQSPRAAVMAAHAEIEQALRRRLALAGYTEPDRRPKTARQLATVAEERRLISPEMRDAIQSVTVLRNMVAHAPAEVIDRQKALDFLRLADSVLSAIEAGTQE